MSRHPAYFSWAPSSYLPQHHRHSGKATRGYILEAQKHQQPGQVSQASSSSGISIFKISHSSCSRIKLSLNKVDINKYHHEPMPAPGLHLPGSPGAQHGTTWDRSRGTKHLLKLWKDSLSGWSAMRHPSCHIWSQYRLHCQVVVPCRSCVWCHQCLSSESIFNLVLGLNWKYTKPTVRRLMYDINDNIWYILAGKIRKEKEIILKIQVSKSRNENSHQETIFGICRVDPLQVHRGVQIVLSLCLILFQTWPVDASGIKKLHHSRFYIRLYVIPAMFRIHLQVYARNATSSWATGLFRRACISTNKAATITSIYFNGL